MNKALLSSARQDWQTPEWFLDLVRQIGPIMLDPASAPDNPTSAEWFYARGGYTPGRLGPCGLSGSWSRNGLAFINPPYGGHLSGPVEPEYVHRRKGVEIGRGRGWAERIAQDKGEWLALVPSRTDTTWWHRMHAVCHGALLWRSPKYGARISFVDPDTGKPKTGSTVPNTVFYHGPNTAKFITAFGPHGRLVPGGWASPGLVDTTQPRT